ncbi:hypothetical protein CBH76_003946 [Salmonella enterica subsp. enterica serovar Splott]|nr:hypothetical protein [Salmonella enterica subsp. enterica]EDU6114718.1 hypothetical protein [Salmonella enterica subsp. enterica serovar Splott]
MLLRYIFIVFSFLPLSSYATSLPGSIDAGIVYYHVANDTTFLMTTRNISTEDSIALEYPSNGDLSCCTVVKGSQLIKTIDEENAFDSAMGNKMNTYEIKDKAIKNKALLNDDIGIAILSTSQFFQQNHPAIKKEHDGLTLSFSDKHWQFLMCTGQEGVNIYSPDALDRIHLYYGWGYSTASSCSDDDFTANTNGKQTPVN